MPVLAPHTRMHPLTDAALRKWAPYATRVQINPEHTDAYWKLLCDQWAKRVAFCVIEHDIEIHADVLPSFARCPEPWCAFPYQGPGEPTGDNLLYTSLGCTRFRSELMTAHPDLVADCPRPDQNGIIPGDWRRLDVWILNRLNEAGYEVHTHWPTVAHHHVYDGRCACGATHEES